MKKILIALLFGSLFALAVFTIALADNGPHGSFTATTDACAGCHRAHTAQFGSNALLVNDPDALCLGCHNGAGAATNVVDGKYQIPGPMSNYGSSQGDVGSPLYGGGFVNALMATAWNGAASGGTPASSRPTTSIHNVTLNQASPAGAGTVWGAGANNSPKTYMTLECVSCHSPHGTAGYKLDPTDPTNTKWIKTASYRLLRWQPLGSSGFTPPTASVNWSGGAFPVPGTLSTETGWLVPDNFDQGHEWYTLGTTGAFAFGDYNAGNNANNVYNVKNPLATGANEGSSNIPGGVNVAFFCAQCHDRYFNNSRLRNNTDDSVYCGSPVPGTVVNNVTLPVYPPVGTPPQHPVDPVRCEPDQYDAQGNLISWGDNGPSGDLLYMYRHASGDIRTSMDGTVAAGGGTSISRSCIACHVAHGTASQVTTLAANASQTQGSALLRMDNRTICLRCHAGAVNFTIAP